MLLKKSEGELQTLIAIGIYTGLRLGDAVQLDFTKVNLKTGMINTVSGKTDMETAPMIHPRLAAIIEKNVKQKKGYLMPKLAALYKSGPSGRVDLTNMILGFFRSCGIETSFKENKDERARPDCGFHSLRHSYSTQLERAHVALADRQKLMAHKTAKMTLHYTHDVASAVLLLPDVMEMGDEMSSASSASVAFQHALEFLIARYNDLADGSEKTKARMLLSKFLDATK